MGGQIRGPERTNLAPALQAVVRRDTHERGRQGRDRPSAGHDVRTMDVGQVEVVDVHVFDFQAPSGNSGAYPGSGGPGGATISRSDRNASSRPERPPGPFCDGPTTRCGGGAPPPCANTVSGITLVAVIRGKRFQGAVAMSSKVSRKLAVGLTSLSLTCLAGSALPQAAATPAGPDMLGFTSAGATQERDLEQRFDAALSAPEMREWLRELSSAPNQVGSTHDKANAQFLLAQFRKWGWNARIETFDVLYPTPKQELVEMTAPTTFKATLHEPPVKGDRTSALEGALPPYNVYGADGDVTAPLVYVNYGMPDDYKELSRYGISVRGKIVIVRYGQGWRGIKPELAYEHGAVGCLIYSDPRDDGYFNGDAYPKGGWRPPEGVQSGSVMNIARYPGDPTTPGYGSVPGAKHLAAKDAQSILKIPVLPISYADAM